MVIAAARFSCLVAFGQSGSAVQTISLVSSALNVGMDVARGGLVCFIDKASGHNFVSDLITTNQLWQLELLPGLAPRIILPSMAGKFRWEHLALPSPALKLIWEDFNLLWPKPLRVEVSITLHPNQPLSFWRIAILKPGQLQLEKVRFPRIPSIRKQAQERLAVPLWMGQLTQTPRRLIADAENPASRLEWSYPGILSLQCLAFYQQNGPGLYLACDDAAAFRKNFAFWGDCPRRIAYEMIHYPEHEERNPTFYAPPYHAIIGAFQGDWLTAAERYRQWGTNQNWAIASRLNRGLVPDWLRNTALWVWNRGKSEGVIPPAIALQEHLKLPVSIIWHWWHGCSYDAGFPEYLPPREGSEHFKAALTAAHRRDIHALVYMNQRLWGVTTRSWSELPAERYAVKGLDGKVKLEIYNAYTQQPCASMCLATPFWRQTYAGLVAKAVRDLAVDGIYMDQACGSLLCYDPAHGHSRGGGTYWINGFRLLTADLRQRTRSAGAILLSGEGVGEAWLPYLDLMLALQVSRERYATPHDGWECIPFFHAVYHPCAVIYGNYSSLTIPPYDELWPPEFAPQEPLKLLDHKFATQFYLEQARTFAWGNQPMLANYDPAQSETRRQEIDYLLKLARVRAQATNYLLYGTFLRPPTIDAAPITVPISHLSIYAGRKGKAETTTKKDSQAAPQKTKVEKIETEWVSSSPPLIVGAWKAKDGAVGIAAANIQSRAVPLNVDAGQYGFKGGDRVNLIDESGRATLGEIGPDGRVTIAVQPLEAVILEFKSRGR